VKSKVRGGLLRDFARRNRYPPLGLVKGPDRSTFYGPSTSVVKKTIFAQALTNEPCRRMLIPGRVLKKCPRAGSREGWPMSHKLSWVGATLTGARASFCAAGFSWECA
jgi:hypothetical protein